MPGPPFPLVADTVERIVVYRTERNYKLVTHFHAETTALRKADMMGVRRLPTADETRLLCYELEMLFVSYAPFLGKAQLCGGRFLGGLLTSSRRSDTEPVA
jgi:hypothetical protein